MLRGAAKQLDMLNTQAGADVEAQQENAIGFTSMNQAAYFGHSTCLRYLLDFKADVNVIDAYGGVCVCVRVRAYVCVLVSLHRCVYMPMVVRVRVRVRACIFASNRAQR